jgi:hypothetical protein
MEAASPTLTPTVNYDDPEAAIRWLTDVLGFHPVEVYRDPDGKVLFAQLVWRTAFVFVSPRPAAGNPWSAVGIALDRARGDRQGRCPAALRAGDRGRR